MVFYMSLEIVANDAHEELGLVRITPEEFARLANLELSRVGLYDKAGKPFMVVELYPVKG